MKKPKRNVNKELLGALLGYAGSSYQDLARRMDPPVSRPMISQIMLDETCNERLMTQVTEILRPAAADLAFEVENLYDQDLFEALFPLVSQDTPDGSQLTEKTPIIYTENRKVK